MTWNRDWLANEGFVGFVSFRDIKTSTVRAVPGVYVLLRPDLSAPTYLDRNPGGSKKGDPTVSVSTLAAAWLEDAHVVYIGKATSLRSRLRQYWRYGSGGNSHRGGRYIWQTANSGDLLVAWREHADRSARDVERELKDDFKGRYGKWPFANLID